MQIGECGIVAQVKRKLSLRGAKRRACTPKWRHGTQAWQSHEIASLRPEHHAVQGFVRNDTLCVPTYLWHSLQMRENR